MIAVVDYGAGNLHSVARALRHVGADITVTRDARQISQASGVVLPGVGAAADTMRGLAQAQVTRTILDAIDGGVPFMGEIPIDPAVRAGSDSGSPIVASSPESDSATAIISIAQELDKMVSIKQSQQDSVIPIEVIE